MPVHAHGIKPSCLRWIVFTLFFAALVTGHAQTFRGGINGTVTDKTGAAIANATVTALQTGTGATRETVSSSGGEFLFQDLALGEYSVTVTFSGFQTVKTDKIMVSAGTIYTLPVTLQLASSASSVEVDAAGLTLDTTTTTQTTVLEAKAVADLPLNGRDFTQMIQLTPGFAGYTGGGYGSLNGTRANQMNWQIDGVDNNDLWHNVPAVNQGGVSGIAGIVLPLDAVDQFSAQTQAGPEGGRNPGGTVNLTLRAGTNKIHGSVYYYNRNEFFGAKSPFSDTKQKVRNYNLGFSVGGPILHDKLFAFVTFEKQRFVIGESGSATEPSVGWQNKAKAVMAANNIPVNPVMQSVLNTLWGTSVLAADTVGVVNNYHSSDPEFGYSYNGLGKIDWHITDKDTLSAHWFAGQGNQVAPVGSQLLSYYEVAPIHVQNIAIVYDHVINAHMTNQVLAGVNYFNQVFNDYNTDYNVQSLGFITGASYTNAPNINIGGYDPVGLTPPEGRNDITGHLTDQFSWSVGKHQFRFGGEYRQAQLDAFYKRNIVGSFTFDGTRNSPAGSNDDYIYPLVDFLAGQTSNATIAIGDPERQVFVNTFFLNAGDSWQVTPRLNFNYGARYDYMGPLHNSWKDMSVFRPELTASGGLAFQGSQIDTLYQRYWKSFSPRLGFSYQLDPSTVLRAGFGFYFDTPNLNPFLDNRPGNAAPNGVEGNPGGPNPVYTVAPVGGANTTIQQNVAIFPSTLNGSPCASDSPCGVFSIDRNFRSAYNENYSLNIEHSISSNVVMQLGYVGSQGRRLLAMLDINQSATGDFANDVVRQQTRPYFSAYPGYGNINQIESIGTSNYNSLQAQMRLMNFHRLSGSVIYTWSHSMDEVTAYRGALPQDNTNFKGNYGASDFDARNTFVSFLSYEVPGGAHWRPFTNGWQVNTLLSFHGGQPFSVAASGDISGTNEGNDRAVQVANPQKGYQGQKPGASWLNPAAFVDPALGSFGTTRRNAYYAPGYGDVDLSVFKNTKIHEWATVQFRVEMFNLLNRTNFAPPSSTSVGGSFTLNDTIGDYNGAPGIGAGEPFNTQLALKVIF
ncbi:MAG: TonB-dependent receptor [Edaphobacter sp.]|uniref:TonB-dependent receptor n=1 Tax=Edaphobacter sp. TaxID=1934404 RepID=UPI0023A4C272|nr:carboxypeptidase regulatory-like domain-containing protein [Edaphobacter sp.]MDE1178099.1 TonB-dependent receptor [Edaphobacter sp.]